MGNKKENAPLPLPAQRCLNKQQAADYLGIGATLLAEIGPLPIKFGRRCVYDVLDLDAWLDEYKQRGRARKEVLWPENEDSIVGKTHPSGGSMLSYQTDDEYVKALSLNYSKKQKST